MYQSLVKLGGIGLLPRPQSVMHVHAETILASRASAMEALVGTERVLLLASNTAYMSFFT